MESFVPKIRGIALVMAGSMTAMSLSADSTMPWTIQTISNMLVPQRPLVFKFTTIQVNVSSNKYL
jgi:hypothetical protein